MEKHSVLLIAAEGVLTPYYHALRNHVRGESVGRAACGGFNDSIRSHQAELALIDCGFNVSWGLRAVKAIKEKSPGVPLLFLTDLSSEETAIRAFRTGARDYFKKPVIIVQLCAVIQGLLKAKRSSWEERRPFARSLEQEPGSIVEITPGERPAGVDRALDFIEQNLNRCISLEELANAACVSKFHFCRVFRNSMGLNPMEYIANARIERAKNILGHCAAPISSVAGETGFKDISTFNRRFRRQTGMTPSAYRRSRRNESVPVRPAPSGKGGSLQQ